MTHSIRDYITEAARIAESSAEERQSILDNIEDEYRLTNIAEALPREYMHPMVRVIVDKRLPNVTIFRGVPEGVTDIRPGDWVALTQSYAAQHGTGKVISKTVPTDDVAWAGTDENEYYYVPRNARSIP